MRLVDTPVHRRRRHALATVALGAALAGAAVGAGASDDGDPEQRSGDAPGEAERLAGGTTERPAGSRQNERPAGSAGAEAGEPAPRSAIAGLSLQRQVGELVVLRYNGTTPPAYVPRALREGRASGVILFRENLTTPAGLRATARTLRAAAERHTTPLICVDQEGGEVRVVPWIGPERPAAGQAADGAVRASAQTAARSLRRDGVNVSLAPVADVPTVPQAAMGPRAFARDAASVSRAIAAAVGGWRAGGVAPTLKHFPGLGGTQTNTDHGSAAIGRSAAQLRQVDLPPFRAGIRAGARLVMLGHARYPALDAEHIASQSPAVLRLLRDELDFDGVTMTDSLEAEAVRSRASPGRSAIRSVQAGVDIVLTTGAGSHLRVYRALLARARRDAAFRARVAESAERVVRLRRDGLPHR